MIDLSAFSLPILFVASIITLLAVSELGHCFGLRVAGEANIATLEAAMLGLLALMIGFTFAMALTRFEARREALLAEANAIGTTALRALLLPAPHGAESVKLLRDYVRIRLDLIGRDPTADDWAAAVGRSNEIQSALWREASLAMAKNNAMVPTGLYFQSLNETFDNQQARLTALRNRVPNIVFVTLYAIAIVAIGFAGYASGTAARRWRLPVYIMSVLVASVILLIQDLDRPSTGSIAVDQQPMIDTAEALTRYSAALGGGTR